MTGEDSRDSFWEEENIKNYWRKLTFEFEMNTNMVKSETQTLWENQFFFAR